MKMPSTSLVLRQCCSPPHILQTAVVIIVVLYIVIGAVIFQALEHENAKIIVERDRQMFLKCAKLQWSMSRNYSDNEEVMVSTIAQNCFKSLQGQWHFADSILFAFGVVTTISKILESFH